MCHRSVGPEATFVTFTDDAPPGSQVLAAVGSGAGPLAVVAPATLNFGNQPDGTTTTLPFTLTNAGTQQLNVTNQLIPSGPGAAQFSVAISGPAQTCVTVAPGGVCSLVASFTPATTGAFTAEVEFMDNSGAGSPQAVILNGSGTGAAPLLGIAPSSVSFGTQPVGITSGMQNVTLTNTGSSLLQLTGIAITGSSSTNFGFVLKGATACQYPIGTLAAGASCTISVDFAPQAAGPVSAELSISDDAAGSPQSVALSGTGGTSGISLAPATLNFASQTVGASSAAQVVNVSNTGTTPLAMSISIAGNNPSDFGETDNCSQSPLAGGKTCVVNITFDPAQSGARSAEVLISDTAPHSPQIVTVGRHRSAGCRHHFARRHDRFRKRSGRHRVHAHHSHDHEQRHASGDLDGPRRERESRRQFRSHQ